MSRPFPHELYVIRHGETEWNARRRMQGALDSPLTARGVAQALAVGRLLAAAGVTPLSHRILTSPQGRARRTATLALGPGGAGFGIDADPLAELAEIGMGAWAGRDRDEIDRLWPGPVDEDELAFYDRAPEGEGLAALHDRAGRVLAALDGPAVLFTHGMTSRALRTRAMGWGPERLNQLPDGQGVVFRLARGRHEVLAP